MFAIINIYYCYYGIISRINHFTGEPLKKSVLILDDDAEQLAAVKALLENCARTRPEVWEKIEASIKKAIRARTESTDTNID